MNTEPSSSRSYNPSYQVDLMQILTGLGCGKIHRKHEYFRKEVHSSSMGIQFDFDNKGSREKSYT